MSGKFVVARDPDSGSCAFYVDGRLAWDFYDKDPFSGPLFHSTNLEDALEEVMDRLGVDYDYVSARPPSEKHWTDYGWEWDAYWPQELKDAIKCKLQFPETGDPEPYTSTSSLSAGQT